MCNLEEDRKTLVTIYVLSLNERIFKWQKEEIEEKKTRMGRENLMVEYWCIYYLQVSVCDIFLWMWEKEEKAKSEKAKGETKYFMSIAANNLSSYEGEKCLAEIFSFIVMT